MRRTEIALWFALVGWVTSLWWSNGRIECAQWFNWLVFPAALWHARSAVPTTLAKAWHPNERVWWLIFFALILYQFFVTGLRGQSWWQQSGAGKDLVKLPILLLGLVWATRTPLWRERFWWSILAIGSLAIILSLLAFYTRLDLTVERFRISWRQWPGLNAVTSGMMIGAVLITALSLVKNPCLFWQNQSKQQGIRHRQAVCILSLLICGFALAATESRGALLAVLVAIIYWQSRQPRIHPILLVPLAGYALFWLLAELSSAGAMSEGLIERRATGRLEIYSVYLSLLSGTDWVFGLGKVPELSESHLGWALHHPHSGYLGQLVGYGGLGLFGMVCLLGVGLWKLQQCQEAPLLIYGMMAILFDGGQVFSMHSIARWDFLVVFVPLVVGMSARLHCSALGRQVPAQKASSPNELLSCPKRLVRS